MKIWAKGAIIGLLVWIILIALYLFSGSGGSDCLDSGEGYACFGGPQNIAVWILVIGAFPTLIFGGPVLSTFGPFGILIWVIGSAIMFILLGILIGWIIGKIKSKKK